MNNTVRLLASASVLAAAALGATQASAAGTTAGTTITNDVTLDYKVGGVSQTQKTTSDSFMVDRKVNLVVVDSDGATTTVSPGQTSAVTAFTITNASNAPLDFTLSATQPSGGTAAHGGTDNFDGTGLKVYVDTNSNLTFDVGDQEVTYLDEIAADASRRVFVVVNIPQGRATGDVAGVKLTATAAEAGTAGSPGATVTQTAGANTVNVMDTVFADDSSNGNTQRDGIAFGQDDYTILTAALAVTKTSRVVSDPFNAGTNPKMIPGAVIEYCISVANAAGGAAATNINVTDTLPSTTTWDSVFGIRLNGTVTGSTCNADGTPGGTHNSGVITATLSDIAAGVTRTVLFRVTVN